MDAVCGHVCRCRSVGRFGHVVDFEIPFVEADDKVTDRLFQPVEPDHGYVFNG
jgi:hypothetical protein